MPDVASGSWLVPYEREDLAVAAAVHAVGAVEEEPAVGGPEDCHAVGQAGHRHPVEEGPAVADGAEGAVPQDKPRELAHVQRGGGVPPAADARGPGSAAPAAGRTTDGAAAARLLPSRAVVQTCSVD